MLKGVNERFMNEIWVLRSKSMQRIANEVSKIKRMPRHKITIWKISCLLLLLARHGMRLQTGFSFMFVSCSLISFFYILSCYYCTHTHLLFIGITFHRWTKKILHHFESHHRGAVKWRINSQRSLVTLTLLSVCGKSETGFIPPPKRWPRFASTCIAYGNLLSFTRNYAQ